MIHLQIDEINLKEKQTFIIAESAACEVSRFYCLPQIRKKERDDWLTEEKVSAYG